MALIMPSELETAVTAKNNLIVIEQMDDSTGILHSICLTIHQFSELVMREKEIVRSALGTGDEL